MAEYTLKIKVPNSGNKHIEHKENLTGSYESYPEDFFRIIDNRDNVRKDIQNQSNRIVSEKHLDKIIKQWIEDIKSGYSPTTITLDLPPQTEPNLSHQTPPLAANSMTSPQPIIPPVGSQMATPKKPNKAGKAKTTASPASHAPEKTNIPLNKTHNPSQAKSNLSSNQTTPSASTHSSKTSSSNNAKISSQKGIQSSDSSEEPKAKQWSNNKADLPDPWQKTEKLETKVKNDSQIKSKKGKKTSEEAEENQTKVWNTNNKADF